MKIKFLPTGQEIDGNPDRTLLQLCTDNNIEIRSICKGVPSCAECRIRIVAGENNLIPPNRAELGLIGTNYYLDGRRLSCQLRCFGAVTVDLTEQIEKADSPNKKVRGFRNQSGKQTETHAVQGTLVLEEKPPQQQQTKSSSEGEPRESRERQQESRQQDRQQGERQQNRQSREPRQNQARETREPRASGNPQNQSQHSDGSSQQQQQQRTQNKQSRGPRQSGGGKPQGEGSQVQQRQPNQQNRNPKPDGNRTRQGQGAPANPRPPKPQGN